MAGIDYLSEIEKIKKRLNIAVVAHFYQRDEVYECADITGDSLELARKCKELEKEWIVFCGVGFMGQSVKIIAPEQKVVMPKVADCSMARMIDSSYFDEAVEEIEKSGVKKSDIFPVTYINSDAEIKAKVGRMGGMVCTSSNSDKIIGRALESGKKIFFVPDRCLGQNIAKKMGLKSCVLGQDDCSVKESDIICFNGFCSVHQLFSLDDIAYYRKRYPGILIAVHPECDPEIVAASDFSGSTSQLIKYVSKLDREQKVAVGTEYNLVNRMRAENTYVLSSTKPECPTMNETSIEDVYRCLKSVDEGNPVHEIFVDEETAYYARQALERMLEIK